MYVNYFLMFFVNFFMFKLNYCRNRTSETDESKKTDKLEAIKI